MTRGPKILADRFELLDHSGRGSVATVFKAIDRQTGATVAVKLVHANAMDLETIQRLAQEAGILATLRHPCIVRVHHTGVDDNARPFVVMEWIEGITLRDRLEDVGGALPLPEVIDIVNQVCSALTEAHAHGVVHRDLKPENVLLCAPEHLAVKVVDFGMAKMQGPLALDLTVGDAICGTPQYMSPERARGQVVGAATDVYAVGVMAYEMLCGRRPFDHPAATRVLMMHCGDPVPPMTEAPRVLWDPVLAALAKAADRRPRPDELAHALEHAAQRIASG